METLQHTQEFIKEVHDKYYPEIAKQIRADLKTVFGKTFKFSVVTRTYAGGGSIDVAIMEGNVDFYKDSYLEARKNYEENPTEENRETLYREARDELTKEGKEVMDEVERIHQLYNHNNSDGMTDYFDVNYYWEVEIGKWNKPYIKK